MKTKARIISIVQAETLPEKITGFPMFSLAKLKLDNELDMAGPNNLRLGHLVERLVGQLLKASDHFKVLYENIQVLDGKRTVGELDFILKEIDTGYLIHMELAYKFYLFDPNISENPINNWIGPNRNDSLIEKLGKLKSKQFPLLYDQLTKTQLPDLNLEEVNQQLCLLVSLFIPFQYKGSLPSVYSKAIKGYYLNGAHFENLDHSDVLYFIPNKKEWGITPSENDIWFDYDRVKKGIQISLEEKQCPLIWQKRASTYSTFFVTWW